ncbi:hypothetical protein GP486_003359 [Trichoglossum hirsutum]|uniref:Ubiquitin-like domain-containing protein n=1 Tax=Trichoglossum hirsutum TaxID=265104 RepID=A0A9P8LD27_9PEZI|nr:hypothetical protein GP486_003359 [Trichoglossum hirsutum]
MPVFSIGTFVSSLSVIKDLIDVLENASKARTDYQELATELRGLERGLTAIKDLGIDEDNHLRFLAVTQAAAGCRQCIDNFLARAAKFQGLGKSVTPKNGKRKYGSCDLLGTSLRKIQWALSKDDVTRFREEVQLHVSSIQMLSELSTRDGKLSSQNKTQQAAIAALSDKLGQSIAMLRTQSELLKNIRPSLIETLNTKQEQLFHTLVDNIAQLRSSFEQQNKIPPQVMLQRPVQFLDACGRLAPFHLEFINSPEAFLAVLKVRFKYAGLRKIEKREFELRETGSKRRLDLSAPWDSVFLPGQKVDMSMESHADTAASENCHMTYRTIEEIEGRPKKRIRKQKTSTQQLLTRFEDEGDEIRNFRRVHVITTKCRLQIRPVSTAPSTPASGQVASIRNLSGGATPTLDPRSEYVPGQDLLAANYSPWLISRADAEVEPTAEEIAVTFPELHASFPSFIHSSGMGMSDHFLDWLFDGVDYSEESA